MAHGAWRGLAAGAAVLAGCIGVAAPAVGAVTVVQAPGLFKVFSPPEGATADFAAAGDFASAEWTADGPWGSFSASNGPSGFSAIADTDAIGPNPGDPAGPTKFVFDVGFVFHASTWTRVDIAYQRLPGSIEPTLLSLVELDEASEPDVTWWTLPTQSSGTFSFVIPSLEADSGRAYVIGYSETWVTAGSASGGITVTFTEVPAPGALAAFGAVGLTGARRRRAS